MRWIKTFVCIVLLLIFSSRIIAQPEAKYPVPVKYDLSTDPVLYTVGYAHLDTQWRWDYPETISKFLKSTLDDQAKTISEAVESSAREVSAAVVNNPEAAETPVSQEAQLNPVSAPIHASEAE